MPDQVAVLGYARTPFGKFGGALRDWPIPRLGALAVRAAVERAGIGIDDVEEVVIGANFPGADRSIARQTALHAGIRPDRTAYTVDQACCSSLTAVTMASRSIRLGDASIAIGGGAENLSKVPYFLEGARWGHRLGHVTMSDQLVVSCPFTGVARAVQAGAEAVSLGIGREEQDAWAARSQERFVAAQLAGLFDDHIVTVAADDANHWGGLARDECPRPGTTVEKLAALETIYDSPTVTAGTAPALATGASALVLADPGQVAARMLVSRAHLSGWSLVCGDPALIASIPATAARQALAKTDLTLAEIDLFEINEAFAAVPLVTTLVLADGDRAEAEKLRERTNVHGGSIAVGHPTGATAGRMVMTAIDELHRRGGGHALVTICGGIGEAAAVIVTV